MSNEAITWAYRQSTGNAGRKAVLVALADKADEAHTCWPAQTTLAAMTDQSERAVRGHLRRLEADGLVRREVRRNADGTRSSDRYVLPVAVAVGVTRKPAKPAVALPAESVTPPADPAAGLPADSVPDHRQILPGNPTDQPSQTPAVSDATPAATKRGTRIDPSWRRSPELVAWQASENIPDDFARPQTAAFIDYWTAKPGAGGVKLDWSATWRNWMRRAWSGREGDDHRRRAGQAGPPLRDFTAERDAAALERARRDFADTRQLRVAR